MAIKNFKLKIKNCFGFTLIELLVVMAILAVLALVGFANFRSMQIRSRDIRKKSDLEQIQRALEMYNNDYKSYPDSSDGKISIGGITFLGGSQFIDINEDSVGQPKGTVYMKEIPGDANGDWDYCYWSDGDSYRLFAQLENLQDTKILSQAVACNGTDYNYGVSSSDIGLTD